MAGKGGKFVPNVPGFYALRSDPELVKDLDRRAKAVADGCNADLGEIGFETGSIQGAKRPQGRWQASVYTRSAAAMNHQRKHKTIERNIDRGRG